MKTRIIPFIAVLAALNALPAQAESVGKAIEKCRATENSLKRLMCYDRMAKSLSQYDDTDMQMSEMPALPRAKPKPSTANVPASRPRVAAAPAPAVTEERDPEASFGLDRKRTPADEVSEVVLTIADLSEGVRGKTVVTFSDGAVWQQVDNTYLKLEKGQTVSIEKGLFGAFFLSVEGLNKRLKVKRVK